MTHTWRVKIVDRDGGVRGAGVLVAPGRVLTCAHVVPSEPFTARFPGSSHEVEVPARVLADGWFPQQADGRGDIAILELTEPAPADVLPANLGRGDLCLGGLVQAYGHPPELDSGVWTQGSLLGSTGPGAEWMQVSGVAVIDRRIEPGFSGGGVFDPETGLVVGMVVAAYQSHADHLAWMVPMEVVARYWRPLADLFEAQSPPRAQTPSVRRIVNLLQTLRTMTDSGKRQTLVESLPVQIDLAGSRHLTTVQDIYGIVTACQRVDGGLAELARVLRFLEGPSRDVEALAAAVSTYNSPDGPADSEAAGAPVLPWEDQNRLCQAFLRVPGLANRRVRDLYVRQVVRGSDGGFAPHRYDEPMLDLWSILDECQRFPGAIRQLAAIARTFNPDHPVLLPLETLIEAVLPQEMLTAGERGDLHGLLRYADRTLLVAATAAATPAVRFSMDTELDEMIQQLESCTTLPGLLPPLFHVVDHVAHHVEVPIQARLHDFVERLALRLGFTVRDVDELCQATRDRMRAAQHRYVVFQLTPDALTPDRYLLWAWLQRNDNAQETFYINDRPLTLPSLKQAIRELLHGLPPHTDEAPLVELILPRSLIAAPVDRWDAGGAEFSFPLGTSISPVVVRSLERLQRQDLHPQWRKKWQWLTANGHRADPRVLHYMRRNDSMSPLALRARLLVDDSVVVHAVGEPPEPSATLGEDAFSAALLAGIPVMVWCRDPEHAQAFETWITQTLTQHGVNDLPEQTRRLRLQSESDSQPHGRHVTLLWDDADRVPDHLRRHPLRAPQLGGPA